MALTQALGGGTQYLFPGPQPLTLHRLHQSMRSFLEVGLASQSRRTAAERDGLEEVAGGRPQGREGRARPDGAEQELSRDGINSQAAA